MKFSERILAHWYQHSEIQDVADFMGDSLAVAQQTGTFIVHETFSQPKIIALKIRCPEAVLIAHPECEEPVLQVADYSSSTTGLIQFVTAEPGAQQKPNATPCRRICRKDFWMRRAFRPRRRSIRKRLQIRSEISSRKGRGDSRTESNLYI